MWVVLQLALTFQPWCVFFVEESKQVSWCLITHCFSEFFWKFKPLPVILFFSSVLVKVRSHEQVHSTPLKNHLIEKKRGRVISAVQSTRPVTLSVLSCVQCWARAPDLHAGADNKLHVVLYSRLDWCRVYVLCARCAQWTEWGERETERECVQNGCHTHSRARRGMWSSPCQACRAASNMSERPYSQCFSTCV